MMNSHQEDAARLAELLAKGEECHDVSLRPFAETANALLSETQASTATLDPGVAATQRAQLISMTTPKPAEVSAAVSAPVPVSDLQPPVSLPPSSTPPSGPRVPRWSWFALGGLCAAALLVAVVMRLPRGVNGPLVGPAAQETIAQLIIPEAHAADAFNIRAESADPAGADAATSFLVTATVPVTAKDVEQHLTIVPPPSVEADATGTVHFAVATLPEGGFRVTPTEPLDGGAVYRLALAAAVQKDDGSLERRDFSWAIQTKQVFRVVSSVPGNRSAGIPINSAVEFTFSMPGFGDPTTFFSIEPAVAGRFETHGRALAFVPTKPFAYGRIYHAVLKAGFGIANSSQVLASDAVIDFETITSDNGAPSKGRVELQPVSDVVEAVPSHEFVLPVYNHDSGETNASFRITGYRLNTTTAKEFLLAYGTQPAYAVALKERAEIFTSRAKDQAFQMDGTVEKKNDYGEIFIRIPGVAAGRYVVKIEPKNGKPTWFYLQTTNVATYITSDAKQSLLWAVNADGGRPLSSLEVRTGSGVVKTDDQGIARFATPLAVTAAATAQTVESTSTDAVEVIEVGSGDLSSLVLLAAARQIRPYWGYWAGMNNQDKTVGYLYAERPLYHPTDKAYVFGMAQDRSSGKGVGAVQVELIRSGFFEPMDPSVPKVYRRINVQTDDAGMFQGEVSWADLVPGWYTLRVQRDGLTIASRGFEIRNFVKPAYSIDVSVTHQAVYAGDVIEGEGRLTFFDGTPVAGMDVVLEAQGAVQASINLTTDASGRVVFRIPTEAWTCDPFALNSYCSANNTVSLMVHPQKAEEAEITGSTFVNVWHSRASMTIDSAVTGTRATLSFTARRVDLSVAGQSGWSDKVLAEPLRNTEITGKMFERMWVKHETGTSYDPIEKVTHINYTYDIQEVPAGSIKLTTDAEGKVSMPFEMKPDVTYRIVAVVKDEKGVEESATTYTGVGWWATYPYNNSSLRLEDLAPQEGRAGYHVGERVHLGFMDGTTVVQESPDRNYLFVEAHIGIQHARASVSPRYDLTFGTEHIPNTSVYGVTWTPTGFVEQQMTLGFDASDRELKVSLTPDAAQYVPGSKAKIHVVVKAKDGASTQNTKVALGVVDEALYAAAYDTGDEQPVTNLYSWVTDGVIFTQRSHMSPELFGGAEKGGGGGGEAIRRTFKDTAAFLVATTDQNGEADVEFTLPDNLTSWRVTAAAVNGALYGGGARTNLRVTKPVFVDVVAPETVLTQDKPLMKLRAYGTALPNGTPVTFTMDAPSLGLTKATATGTAGTPIYVAIPSLVEGDHAFIVRVSSDKGTDAIERHLHIASSRFMRDEAVTLDLAPNVTLPDAGISNEVTASFIPQNRAAALPRIEALKYSWSRRVEARVAIHLANNLLHQYFGRPAQQDDGSILSYQQSDGGIGLLPYSSSDVDVSSKVVAADPNMFDRTALINYFWSFVLRKDASREEQIAALSGLAALQEPVLPELQTAAHLANLFPHERLLVARGLFAIGDAEGARAVFDELLKAGEEHDGQLMLRLGKEQALNLAATAEVAAMAAELAHPSAPKLLAYVNANWTNDVLTNLDRAVYLSRTLPLLISGSAKVTYAVNGTRSTVDVTNGQTEERVFTAAEWKQLQITQVEGPVALALHRRVTSVPAQSPDISIHRTYAKPDASAVTTLVEGDTLIVHLDVTWKDAAPSGCYTLRDHVPAGFSPLMNIWSNGNMTENMYPIDRDAESITFIACRPTHVDGHTGDLQASTWYQARVIARGSYVGEPAVLQSMEAPSVAAVSTYDTITVR